MYWDFADSGRVTAFGPDWRTLISEVGGANELELGGLTAARLSACVTGWISNPAGTYMHNGVTTELPNQPMAGRCLYY
ncbi:hypothetical protein Ct61P_10642 [Colletotrichum tofieldiae]|nr:hypothetical protein Ct61P_10642 [Colletotrichum tofieldiae]